MKNSEYYKNRSITELTKIFADICAKKSLEQTTERFTNWLNAEHTTTTLVPGDVIIQDLHGSKVDVVISIDDACGSIKLRPLACVLNDNNPNRDQNVSISYLTLFTGKPICNINDLQKDPSGKYNFTAKPSCPMFKADEIIPLKTQTTKKFSRKDLIINYMEKVMLIDPKLTYKLRGMSVKNISEKAVLTTDTYICMYIFNFLYNLTPSKFDRCEEMVKLNDMFIYACTRIAAKWLSLRQTCYLHEYVTLPEFNDMIKFEIIGYSNTANNTCVMSDGSIRRISDIIAE